MLQCGRKTGLRKVEDTGLRSGLAIDSSEVGIWETRVGMMGYASVTTLRTDQTALVVARRQCWGIATVSGNKNPNFVRAVPKPASSHSGGV